MKNRIARLEVGELANPRWTRGPVLLQLAHTSAVAPLIAHLRETNRLKSWLVESSWDTIAFTLETRDPADEPSRLEAVAALGDALVEHTRLHAIGLVEWALLPARRRLRRADTVADNLDDFAAQTTRLAVLQGLAAPFFARFHDGRWPLRSNLATFEAYHFYLGVPEREIIRAIVNDWRFFPQDVFLRSVNQAALDTIVGSLEATGWIKTGPAKVTPKSLPYRAQGGATRSSLSAFAPGPLLAGNQGRALKLRESELLFDR